MAWIVFWAPSELGTSNSISLLTGYHCRPHQATKSFTIFTPLSSRAQRIYVLSHRLTYPTDHRSRACLPPYGMSNCAQRSAPPFPAAVAGLRQRSLLQSHADDAQRTKPFHRAWAAHHLVFHLLESSSDLSASTFGLHRNRRESYQRVGSSAR